MSHATELLRAVRDDEKRLKQLRDLTPIPSQENAATIHELIIRYLIVHEYAELITKLYHFARLRANFQTLIVNYSDECSDSTLTQLWRCCFYRHIEDFRKGIKNAKARIEAQPKGLIDGLVEMKTYLASLSLEFSKYLANSSRYFQRIVSQVTNVLRFIFMNSLETYPLNSSRPKLIRMRRIP